MGLFAIGNFCEPIRVGFIHSRGGHGFHIGGTILE